MKTLGQILFSKKVDAEVVVKNLVDESVKRATAAIHSSVESSIGETELNIRVDMGHLEPLDRNMYSTWSARFREAMKDFEKEQQLVISWTPPKVGYYYAFQVTWNLALMGGVK